MKRLTVLLLGLAGLSLVQPPASDRLIAADGSATLLGQSTGGRGGSGGDGGGFGFGGAAFDAQGRPVNPALAAAVPFPAQIVGVMKRSAQVCRGVPDEYAIDCLIVHLRQALSVTPQAGRYAEVHNALSDAVRKLDRLVVANRDESKPMIRVQAGGVSTPRMRAIRPDAVRRANAEAATIVAEAETVLLRSAARSGAKLEYTRIAEAVGSNKLLLRS
ncbi:MAG: hypothetical protein KDK24_00250 [Pseudooceanicola sp.]|nr:hypothetical protein [Pseudooceanicola sp.]